MNPGKHKFSVTLVFRKRRLNWGGPADETAKTEVLSFNGSGTITSLLLKRCGCQAYVYNLSPITEFPYERNRLEVYVKQLTDKQAKPIKNTT